MTEKRYEWCADGLDIWDNQKEERIDYDFPVELNKLHDENEQLKQYNQQITKLLEDGGVILTKNQLNSLITLKNDDSVEVRYLKTANAKLKDELRALREYIQKKELKE